MPRSVRPDRPTGTRYPGGAGTRSWRAHRVTGLLLVAYLLIQVAQTALVRVSPEAYDRVADLYRTPAAALLGVVVVGALLFHALNGLRVAAVDLWTSGARQQRPLLWAVLAGWFLLMVPTVYLMLERPVRALFGTT